MKSSPIALCLALLLLAGCATIQHTDPGLEVAIEHLSAPEFQLLESRAVAKIRIDNETDAPITLVGGVHRIEINGKRIGKVMDGESITIPPFASVVRELPLLLTNLALIRSINQTIETKQAEYQLQSRLTVAGDTGSHSVTLRRSGEVSLDELVPEMKPAGDSVLPPTGITPTPIAVP